MERGGWQLKFCPGEQKWGKTFSQRQQSDEYYMQSVPHELLLGDGRTDAQTDGQTDGRDFE